MWEAVLAKVGGWFTGVLKALPAVAVLQDKNDKLTADNAALARELACIIHEIFEPVFGGHDFVVAKG